eukprot:scaffold95748_cov37-Prasinocladus_malaysianus.AAC.1
MMRTVCPAPARTHAPAKARMKRCGDAINRQILAMASFDWIKAAITPRRPSNSILCSALIARHTTAHRLNPMPLGLCH